MIGRIGLAAVGLAAVLAGEYQTAAKAPAPMPTAAATPERSTLANPYLKGPPDNSVLLSPAPPAVDSLAEARDVMAAQAALARRGTPRWTLATSDADLSPGRGDTAFSCAAGVALSAKATPATHHLLLRSMADLGMSTSVIKRTYKRARPFIVNGQPSCTPEWESRMRQDGSYPSGHSAIGYGLGLILAELLPARASQLVARGRAFGDSRRICNVHWLSDIEEGRISAAATVAMLHAEPAFRADLETARRELARPHPAPTGCDAEQAALAG